MTEPKLSVSEEEKYTLPMGKGMYQNVALYLIKKCLFCLKRRFHFQKKSRGIQTNIVLKRKIEPAAHMKNTDKNIAKVFQLP